MASVKRKIPCKYGAKCYRKNTKHLEEYSHDVADTEAEVDEKTKEGGGPPKKKARLDDYFRDEGEESSESQTSATGFQTDALAENKENADAPTEIQWVREVPVEGMQIETVATSSTAQEGASGDGTNTNREASDDSETTAEVSSPSSPENPRENIKSKFLVEMPDDFYEFWEFAKSVNSGCPSAAFASSLGLHLVGPFDVLSGKTTAARSLKKKPNYLCHWRYYYDPPELLTVVKGDDKTQFHMGYYRDDPKEMPAFVASNSAAENCVLKPVGENLFAAVNLFIEERVKKSADKSLSDLQKKLRAWAEKCGFTLEKKTAKMKARDKKAVCKCFHGVGVVVPVDKNGVGYRPLPETQASLKNILKKIRDSGTEEERNSNFDPLMDLVTLIQFANDECDYGEGLELGLDLFCYGGEVFHKPIRNLLPLGYQLLGRPEFAQVIEAHLTDRKHSAALSELE